MMTADDDLEGVFCECPAKMGRIYCVSPCRYLAFICSPTSPVSGMVGVT